MVGCWISYYWPVGGVYDGSPVHLMLMSDVRGVDRNSILQFAFA